MTGTFVDATEIDRLAVDLGNAPVTAGRYLRAAVDKNAHDIRDTWREKATGLAHAPAFPYSITYDVEVFRGFGSSVIQAEIGPDKERNQGALGNLIEYGSVNNPPMGLGHAALEENQADLERGVDLAITDSLADLARGGSLTAAASSVIRGRR